VLLKGLRILVVDDEVDICQLLTDVLEVEGATCVSASSGEEGLSVFDSAGPFDLILSDIKMPGMNGDELVRLIRRQDRKVFIICMSGYTMYKKEDILSWGANAYLEKPLEMDELVQLIAWSQRTESN